jgi:hypothetical protein
MAELYFNQIPKFIRKGEFFQPLTEEFKSNKESIIIPYDRFQEDDKINSLEDLLLYFNTIDYFMVPDRYISFHIYEYVFANRAKIIENYELITHIKKYPEMHFLVNYKNKKFDTNKIITIVTNNYLNIVKILDLWDDKYNCRHIGEIAAEYGNLHCLKYIFNKTTYKDIWDDVLKKASKYGNLPIVIYLHQHGCLLTKNSYELAARSGHLNCLKYLIEYGNFWQYGTIENALLFGNFNCLLILVSTDASILPKEEIYICIILNLCIIGGNLDCLRLIHHIYHENKLILYGHCALRIAAKFGRLDCIKYMYENGCEFSNLVLETAKKYEHLDCVEYLMTIIS